MFVLAGCGVGPSADPELDLALLEVSEELVPFLVGDIPVFLAGPQASTTGDERPVVFDHVAVVDGDVTLSGVEALMAEELGGDVNGQTGGDGFGGEDATKVVRGESDESPVGV